MHIKRCDGCHAEMGTQFRSGQKRTVIEGRRVDGMSGGYPLVDSDAEFHWCLDCALVAFKAVENAAASRG